MIKTTPKLLVLYVTTAEIRRKRIKIGFRDHLKQNTINNADRKVNKNKNKDPRNNKFSDSG